MKELFLIITLLTMVSTATMAVAATGRLVSNYVSGTERFCVYNVNGSTQIVTQRIASVCPLTKRF